MISATSLHKWYGSVHALRGVSFELEPGQVAGLLGPNGAGKSTTIKLITGMIPPDQGSVSILGHDTLTDSIRARRSIGYLPESAPLYPEMTVEGYLRFRAGLIGIAAKGRQRTIDHAIERCWLGEVRRRRIGHLSKGFRQRAGLASAILNDPPVLVLDEPTNGLDPAQIAQMRALVRELGERRTMLISSHILPEIQMICSRILIIAGGELRADGAPEALINAHAGQRRYVVEARVETEGEGGAAEDGALGRVCRELGERADVTGVEREVLGGGWTRLVVTPSKGEDLREMLAEVCRARGVFVRELSVEAPTLEDVFMSLTSAAERVPVRATAEEAA